MNTPHPEESIQHLTLAQVLEMAAVRKGLVFEQATSSQSFSVRAVSAIRTVRS